MSKMTFLEQARLFGYPATKKHVVTEDGYILELHRIPGKRNETLEQALSTSKQPILFVHGLLGSSQQWIANGPGKAWGFAAVDTGLYDAWFINLRGNKYSREHRSMEADSDVAFWDFSFEEFGSYDLPAAVRAIQAESGEKKVALVAYSEGTTAAFYALSQKGGKESEFCNNNVSIFVALGPMTQLNNVDDPILRLLGW